MNVIVFSTNRAYQLDAFLNSAIKNAEINPNKITVLYKYDDHYLKSLKKLISEHKEVNFIKENDFYNQTVDLLKNSDEIVSFATDDALFTRKLEKKQIEDALNKGIICYSSRLGFNLNFCYPLNSSQKIPNGQIIENNFYFNWRTSQLDWCYPMSVDGHFFKKDFLCEVLKNIKFVNPNTLESQMSIIPKITNVSDFMSSGFFSHYFNVPINVVQNVFSNRHGNVTIEDLDSLYSRGIRFDIQKIYHFLNDSAHQELEIL